MKKLLLILICLFVQFEMNFAQSPAPIDLGIVNGKAKTLAKPVYPETAKKSGVGGAVKVNVTVDEQGNVIKAEAVDGELLLRDAALVAARASKFEPYLVKAKAVKFSGFLVFNFDIQKGNLSNFDDLTEMDFKLLTNELSIKDISAKASTDDDYAKLLTRCGTGASAGGKTSDDFDAVIKVCTEGIERFKKQEGVTDFYYYRGLARYLRVRQAAFQESNSGKFKPFAEFLPKFSASASETDYEIAFDTASDLMTGMSPVSAAARYKNGHLYEGEMLALLALKKPSAVSRIKNDSAAYATKAREEFAKAETTVADKTVVTNGRMVLDEEMNKLNSASDAQSRYKQYDNEYSAANDAYIKSARNFQAVLQAQQSAAAPSTTPVCEALSSMYANFQKVVASRGKIIVMKNNGELNFLPVETFKQLSGDEAATPTLRAKIGGAAEHFGCKLN